jgi:hypothetical protein
MKKLALLFVAFAVLYCISPANAQTPATTATTPPAATTLSPQNQRMKDCAAQYHAQGIAKSQYKTFMSGCLKNPSSAVAPAAAPAAAPITKSAPAALSQKDKMKSCNDNAKTQSLTGDARKTFMKSCLSNK